MWNEITLIVVESIPFPKDTMRVEIPEILGVTAQWYGPAGPDEYVELRFRFGRITQNLAIREFFTLKQRSGLNNLYWVNDRDGKLFLEQLEIPERAGR